MKRKLFKNHANILHVNNIRVIIKPISYRFLYKSKEAYKGKYTFVMSSAAKYLSIIKFIHISLLLSQKV